MSGELEDLQLGFSLDPNATNNLRVTHPPRMGPARGVIRRESFRTVRAPSRGSHQGIPSASPASAASLYFSLLLRRQLDSNLFADYKCDIHRAVAYTSRQPAGRHPEKYSLSTAAEVQKSMLRAWKWSPEPARIVQDISRILAGQASTLKASNASLMCMERSCPTKKARSRRGKQTRAREFKPPPDCPETTATVLARFRELDPSQLPPKKRARV